MLPSLQSPELGHWAEGSISSAETPALGQAGDEPRPAGGEGAQAAIAAADRSRLASGSQHCTISSVGLTARLPRNIFWDQSSGGSLASPFGGAERVVASPDCCVPTVSAESRE